MMCPLPAGQECTSLNHSATSPQSEVYCFLPPGTGVAKTVILVQGSGEVTDSNGLKTMSYLQCPAGQRAVAVRFHPIMLCVYSSYAHDLCMAHHCRVP